jgi:L-ascorbate metabolism protein UlaG (beta-lactamase superfamily)
MDITVTWIGGATWILDIQHVRIACDPVLCPAGTIQHYGFFRSARLNEPVYTPQDFHQIDLWLITHAHEDHLDGYGIGCIASDANIITHANAAKSFAKTGHTNLKVLRWGEQQTLRVRDTSITVEAIPAIHGPNPLVAFFAGGVNGYWLTVQTENQNVEIYVTGDTVLHPQLLRAIRGRHADVLIANLGAAKQDSWMGPLTLSADMLNTLLKEFEPKACFPVHFGTFEHYIEPISKVEAWNNPNILILQPGNMQTIAL